jgi:hypothetical protein
VSAAYAKKTAPPPFCFFFLLSSFISLCLFRACLGKSSSLFMRKKTQSKRAVFFFRSQDRGQDRRRRVRKRHFFRHLYIKCIILPRQARDKHRENSKKVPFSQARLLLWWAGAAAEKAGLGRACLWPHAYQLGQDAERSALRAAPAQGAFSAI